MELGSMQKPYCKPYCKEALLQEGCQPPHLLKAVETNLASKDSHWVFVNEVRAPEW
ncbi:Hypothetical predicted protein [Marmota monax]|uniref:Uncharacterized protein n=1 Tax=Marmota monax TaxID=9995 RepID=A0A5E4AXG9_MARMO|nr:Hypothetical predicted protein [Marmota monax]